MGTLYKSKGQIPIEFLRACGIPQNMIDYIPSLTQAGPIQRYSCFLSHSTKDKKFVNGLYQYLTAKDVQCWYAPENLKIGDDFREKIHIAIDGANKLLLVLSKESINSEWVEEEVLKAYALEKERGKKDVLFPIMIDDEITTTTIPWAFTLYKKRHIGDFRCEPGAKKYKEALERLFRDLEAQPTVPNNAASPD